MSSIIRAMIFVAVVAVGFACKFRIEESASKADDFAKLNVSTLINSVEISAMAEAAAKSIIESTVLPEMFDSYDVRGTSIVAFTVMNNSSDQKRVSEVVLTTFITMKERERRVDYICTSGFVNSTINSDTIPFAGDTWKIDESEDGSTICEKE